MKKTYYFSGPALIVEYLVFCVIDNVALFLVTFYFSQEEQGRYHCYSLNEDLVDLCR